MNWNESVDVYCERLGPEFWSEPLNAVSNLAFMIVSVLLLRRYPEDKGWFRFFSVLIFVVGVGSFLFHTFATRWAGLADVIPIFVFILSYIAFMLKRTMGLVTWKGVSLAVIYYAGTIYLIQPLTFLKGAWMYTPAWLTFWWMSLLMVKKSMNPRGILIAGGLFTLSLGMRMLDQPLCATLPVGTHFMWHIFNALVIGQLALEARKET